MFELSFKKLNEELIRHKLTRDSISIGRAPGNDICLPDPDISRTHLVLERRGSALVLTDKSTNGTYLNGEKVTSREVTLNDTIKIGQWLIQLVKAGIDPERETQIITDLVPTQIMSYQPESLELTYQRWMLQRMDTDAPPIQITKILTSIGSAKSNDIILDDAYASAFHARIENRHGAFFIKDLQSTNGVFVNGKKVIEAELPVDALIDIGHIKLRFFALERKEKLAPSQKPHFEGLYSSDPKMRAVFSLIERVAKSDAVILIHGESGTGKELIAQAIHRQSLRESGPLITINCGAISKDLIESELFGHEKGAFTSAHQQRKGVFEQAQGGTLFLDEIGELPLDLQPRLLRVLENGEIRRVGGSQTLRVDVRVIAATHKDLSNEVNQGRFREDLFYRLYVVPISIPALRERKADIPHLADYFLKTEFAHGGLEKTLSASALDVLMNHSWPGNVRELKNVLSRAVLSSTNKSITADDLQFAPRGGKDLTAFEYSLENPSVPKAIPKTLRDIEKEKITAELIRNHWNKKQTAKVLGIAKSTLFEKIKRYQIEDKGGED